MRQDLVERARQGDREAFGELAAGEVDRLNAIARLVLRDSDLAEDAVQEALVRCWRQLPKLRDVDRFDAWMYRILMHAAQDEISRRRRFQVVVQSAASQPTTVADRSHEIADRDQLEQGFRHLSVDHRAVVVLHHYVGLADARGRRRAGNPDRHREVPLSPRDGRAAGRARRAGAPRRNGGGVGMNDRLDLLVTDWLRADAPAEASPRTLEGALARVATASQERYVTQRLLGDRIGRRRDVRLALVLGLLLLAIAGAFAIAGALLREQPKPVGPLTNGSIVFRANGAAGSDLSGPLVDVRAGESDMFAVEAGGQPRRIVGDDVDHDIQMCPTVSPDGTRLAYLALDSTTITPTPAPVPAGRRSDPNPSYVGPLSLWFEIVGLDANGTPSGEARRIAIPPTADGGVGCPRWSPDGTRLAFTDRPARGWPPALRGCDLMRTHDASPRRRIRLGADGRQMVVGDTAAWLSPGRRRRCPTTDRRGPERRRMVARRLKDRDSGRRSNCSS